MSSTQSAIQTELQQKLATLSTAFFQTEIAPEDTSATIVRFDVENKENKEVATFLHLVAQGQEKEVKAMLNHNPALALASGTVTDKSGRTFTDITGFQYAMWSLDWHTWTIIQSYLSEAEAKKQVEAAETGTWVKTLGEHINLTPLNEAYADKHNDDIGIAQRLLPMHMIHEFCHPTRPFSPCPNFRDDTAPPLNETVSFTSDCNHENLKYHTPCKGSWFNVRLGTFKSRTLGDTFMYVRGNQDSVQAHKYCFSNQPLQETVRQADADAFCALIDTRMTQREELIAGLKSKLAPKQ